MDGSQNISDGLWDIPVSKKNITPNNYALPLAHPSLYKDRTHQAHNTSILQNTSIPQNTLHSIPKELTNLNDLIDHNILDSILHHQLQQDAKQYQNQNN